MLRSPSRELLCNVRREERGAGSKINLIVCQSREREKGWRVGGDGSEMIVRCCECARRFSSSSGKSPALGRWGVEGRGLKKKKNLKIIIIIIIDRGPMKN